MYGTARLENLVLDANELRDTKLSDVAKIPHVKYVSMENVGFVLPATVEQSTAEHESKINNIDLAQNNLQTTDILRHLAIFRELEIIRLADNAIHKLNGIEHIKTLFPNITSISLEKNAVDCQWLATVLPAFKEAEIELNTGSLDELLPHDQQGNAVDGQLCGPKN